MITQKRRTSRISRIHIWFTFSEYFEFLDLSDLAPNSPETLFSCTGQLDNQKQNKK